MHVPVMAGIIKRRILVNYRVHPECLAGMVPPPLQLQLVGGMAMAGICLIRLEAMRPHGFPAAVGLSSENAAHRLAVVSPQGRTGVFVPRRDTDSVANHLAGGRFFPGVQHLADFVVTDDGTVVDVKMQARDGGASVHVRGAGTNALPSGSVFTSLAQASEFFRGGCLGWSPGRGPGLDGMCLETEVWAVSPLEVTLVQSSFFEDSQRFPPGAVAFDCALLMRDIPHRWVAEDTALALTAGE